jgi:phosphoribosylanthranilate isomerase
MVRVKICGLTRQEDAEYALELGADALGFVFEPSSPRYLEPERRSLIRAIEPYAFCVAVFGKTGGLAIAGCNAVQAEDPPFSAHPDSPSMFKVIRPRSTDESVVQWDLKEWISKNSLVKPRAVVLDAFDEELYGGTGKRVDWDFAERFKALCPVPMILAGGLTPDNVADAIRKVRPYAVDVSSGVEYSPGIKDPSKLRDFIQAAREAGASP